MLRLRISIVLLFTLFSVVYPLSVDFKYLKNNSDFSYTIMSTTVQGNMHDASGYGAGLGLEINKNLSCDLNYYKFNQASSTFFMETFELSSWLINLRWKQEIMGSFFLYLFAGANYSHWAVQNSFTITKLEDEIGYQYGIGLQKGVFFTEIEYSLLQAREIDAIQTTAYSPDAGRIVVTGYEDMILKNFGVAFRFGCVFSF